MNSSNQAFLIGLYQQHLSSSPAYNAIQSNSEATIIVYDNSPEPMNDVLSAKNVEYHHDSRNLGLATAYNYAITWCREHDVQWLTLFDQDTEVPDVFFATLEQTIVTSDASCILPTVLLPDGKQLSPFAIEPSLFLGGLRNCDLTQAGINSGNTLNLAALPLEQLFEDAYPLDFLDYAFFKKLSEVKGKISLMPVELIQHLSVSNFNSMSLDRFRSFMQSENRFVREFYPELLGRYHLRLIARLIKACINRVDHEHLAEIVNVLKEKA